MSGSEQPDETDRTRSADPAARERRRAIRRATAWTAGFAALAILVALGGAALIARGLAAFGGLPFVPTWLTIAAFVLLVPLAFLVARIVVKRRQ